MQTIWTQEPRAAVTRRGGSAIPAAMLHINELSYRVEGRLLLDNATAGIPTGHKVGLVGRNGTGKTTLLKLIIGDIAPDTGSITVPRNARIGHVAQEAPGGDDSLIDWVLAADTERAGLLEEAETATDPERIADIHHRLNFCRAIRLRHALCHARRHLCLLYTSPSPRDRTRSRMPSSA